MNTLIFELLNSWEIIITLVFVLSIIVFLFVKNISIEKHSKTKKHKSRSNENIQKGKPEIDDTGKIYVNNDTYDILKREKIIKVDKQKRGN